MAPPKINPNTSQHNIDLTVLNKLAQVVTSCADPQVAMDGEKIIECFKFIKVNETFITYAIEKKSKNDQSDDGSIYVYPHDRAAGVLRDTKNTSFHFYSAADIPKEYRWPTLLKFVEEFESAASYALEQGGDIQKEFIMRFKYEQTTGCLDNRVDRSVQYIRRIRERAASGKAVDDLDAIFTELSRRIPSYDNPLETYRAYFEYFADRSLFGETASYRGRSELITPTTIETYLSEVLSLQVAVPQPPAASDLSHKGNDYAYALRLITSLKALFKNVTSLHQKGEKQDPNWPFYLEQLFDPENKRPPSSQYAAYKDRSQTFNPQTGKLEVRDLQLRERGAKKDTPFIKKTSTTLLPRDGRIESFTRQGYDPTQYVALLFDIRLCRDLDDLHADTYKYVFEKNADTNSRSYYKDGIAYHAELKSIARRLSVLRKEIDTQRFVKKAVTAHNEILARPCRNAIIGIAATNDNLLTLLNAIYRKALVNRYLGLNVPILIITPTYGVKEYPFKEQLGALLAAESKDENHKWYAKQYFELSFSASRSQADFLNSFITKKQWEIAAAIIKNYSLIRQVSDDDMLFSFTTLIKQNQPSLAGMILTHRKESFMPLVKTYLTPFFLSLIYNRATQDPKSKILTKFLQDPFYYENLTDENLLEIAATLIKSNEPKLAYNLLHDRPSLREEHISACLTRTLSGLKEENSSEARLALHNFFLIADLLPYINEPSVMDIFASSLKTRNTPLAITILLSYPSIDNENKRACIFDCFMYLIESKYWRDLKSLLQDQLLDYLSQENLIEIALFLIRKNQIRDAYRIATHKTSSSQDDLSFVTALNKDFATYITEKNWNILAALMEKSDLWELISQENKFLAFNELAKGSEIHHIKNLLEMSSPEELLIFITEGIQKNYLDIINVIFESSIILSQIKTDAFTSSIKNDLADKLIELKQSDLLEKVITQKDIWEKITPERKYAIFNLLIHEKKFSFAQSILSTLPEELIFDSFQTCAQERNLEGVNLFLHTPSILSYLKTHFYLEVHNTLIYNANIPALKFFLQDKDDQAKKINYAETLHGISCMSQSEPIIFCLQKFIREFSFAHLPADIQMNLFYLALQDEKLAIFMHRNNIKNQFNLPIWQFLLEHSKWNMLSKLIASENIKYFSNSELQTLIQHAFAYKQYYIIETFVKNSIPINPEHFCLLDNIYTLQSLVEQNCLNLITLIITDGVKNTKNPEEYKKKFLINLNHACLSAGDEHINASNIQKQISNYRTRSDRPRFSQDTQTVLDLELLTSDNTSRVGKTAIEVVLALREKRNSFFRKRHFDGNSFQLFNDAHSETMTLSHTELVIANLGKAFRNHSKKHDIEGIVKEDRTTLLQAIDEQNWHEVNCLLQENTYSKAEINTAVNTLLAFKKYTYLNLLLKNKIIHHIDNVRILDNLPSFKELAKDNCHHLAAYVIRQGLTENKNSEEYKNSRFALLNQACADMLSNPQISHREIEMHIKKYRETDRGIFAKDSQFILDTEKLLQCGDAFIPHFAFATLLVLRDERHTSKKVASNSCYTLFTSASSKSEMPAAAAPPLAIKPSEQMVINVSSAFKP